MAPCLTVALGGNPNIGKSTLFNILTRSCQHVGNWPGKTVERVEGMVKYKGKTIRVVDLPGIYSLTPNSLEELIARDFIIQEKPDVILAMADATNLERSLYLILQAMELTPRLVLAVNMVDIAQNQGIKIDTQRLSTSLGIPVVPIIASTGYGLSSLLETIVQVGEGLLRPNPRLDYGEQIECYLGDLTSMIVDAGINDLPARWVALKILENDREMMQRIQCPQEIVQRAEHYRTLIGPHYQVKITEALYCLAQKACREAIVHTHSPRTNFTELLDSVILHRFAAFPVIIALLGIVFGITLLGASPLSDLLERFFTWLATNIRSLLGILGVLSWITGVLVDGLVTGLGAVISVMLPTMAIFFVIFDLLENSGFIPRIAFIMDRPMRAAGSQGKHCVSCLMAFGCSIPAVVSTRIMNGSHRLMAILTSSMLPCNGRLGVMLALTAIFFGPHAPLIMLLLVAIAIAAMMLSTFLLNITVLRGQDPGFLLEIPPYRMPDFRKVLIRTFREKVVHVLARAALVAAPMTVIIWLLSNLPAGVPSSETITGRLAAFLNPLGNFLGLDGQVLVAMLYALPAKEVVLGALAITSGLGTSLGGSHLLESYLTVHWSGLKALTFLVFFMLYLPCLYTVIITYQETRSLKWATTGLFLSLTMAFIFTILVSRLGVFLCL